MNPLRWSAILGCVVLLCSACNRNTPEPASVDIASTGLRLTIVRMASDPFLQRFTLTLSVTGTNGCSSSTELFPDTGYSGRRNIYYASKGKVYVIGQYDARIVDPGSCQTRLSEFRDLDREVIFIGSFDQDDNKRWTYVPSSQRSELPFEKR